MKVIENIQVWRSTEETTCQTDRTEYFYEETSED